MKNSNWFLYIGNHGESGVGRCSFSPGIMDCPGGELLVVTDSYLTETKTNTRSPELIKKTILSFFGKKL